MNFVRVPINGTDVRNVDLDWETREKDEFQRLLQTAHTLHKPILCLCRPVDNDRRRLSVRQLGKEASPTFILAKYPDSGDQHDPACRFFEPSEATTGRSEYEAGVITTHDDGTISILLEHALDPGVPGAPQPPIAEANGGIAVRRAAITLRGLLDALWERAEYDRWSPAFEGRRTWYTFAAAIERAAGGIKVRRLVLATRLCIFGNRPHRDFVLKTQARWQAAFEAGGTLLLIAPLTQLAEVELGKTGAAISLESSRDFRAFVWAREALIVRLRTSFGRELAGLRDENARVVCLLHIKPETPRNANDLIRGEVIDGAIVRTTTTLIPVASGLEARVADRLCEQQRAFRKPLRYDGQGMFPDFELLDTAAPTPMEVFGLDDAAYVQRREEKLVALRRIYGSNYWAWDATLHPKDMPAFPMPDRRNSNQMP